MIIANSIYKIIELVGTSEKSWEDAARGVIETTVENGKVRTYRTRLNVSFKVQA